MLEIAICDDNQKDLDSTAGMLREILQSEKVEYVMGCMKDTATKITNIRYYLITALYNAPSTMSHYY